MSADGRNDSSPRRFDRASKLPCRRLSWSTVTPCFSQSTSHVVAAVLPEPTSVLMTVGTCAVQRGLGCKRVADKPGPSRRRRRSCDPKIRCGVHRCRSYGENILRGIEHEVVSGGVRGEKGITFEYVNMFYTLTFHFIPSNHRLQYMLQISVLSIPRGHSEKMKYARHHQV